jgi:hypothetical protein
LLQKLPKDAIPFFPSPAKPERIESGFDLGKFEVNYKQYDYYIWELQQAGRDDTEDFQGIWLDTTTTDGLG